ncbi:MAG TPA: PEGA domain-containing protein [Nannocystaceae bacterium]|nr:PEGA domain-containing protein [Nannocystaceae bacterium]
MRVLVAVIAAALALGPVPIASAARPEIAVAPLQTDGEIPEFWQGEIATHIEGALGEDAEVRALDASACDDAKCDDAAIAGATHLVRATLHEDARVYTLDISVTELATGERFESSEQCPLCGLAEVAEMSARQSKALVRKLGQRADAVGRMTIESRPSGATIVVDGVARGRTPATIELTPGRHELALERSGYGRVQRNVATVADVRETWSVELVQRETRRPRARAMTIAGSVMLGLAAPALISGSTFLALDGKPYRRRCSGADVDADGDCRMRYATSVHGGVMIGLAAALVLGGIVLLTQARTRSAPARAALQVHR